MKIFSFIQRANQRISGAFRTRAAREIAAMASSARLTRTGEIQNILGIKHAITVGENSVISGRLRTYGHAGKIIIGEWVFIGEESFVVSASKVKIGNRVLISHGVSIIDTTSHPIDAIKRGKQTKTILSKGHPRIDPGLESAPICICDDAWISFGAAILRGVTIGEGAIVGACSVVTKDVEPWTVVAGNPARVVRRLDDARGLDESLRNEAMNTPYPHAAKPEGGG